jgi:vacuolar-type H+-ATPase subunit E/Vma4
MVAQMTKEELQQVIESSVESKLLEMLDDPDEGLVLRESVRKRLLKSKAAVKLGERGKPLEDVVEELGI